MFRRHAVSLLLGALAGTRLKGAVSLHRFLEPSRGVAVLLNARTRQLIAVNSDLSPRIQAPPGSTIKPFVLAALLRLNRLSAGSSFTCPGRLRIGGRKFDCVHPVLATPLHVDTALAYSCNCFVANAAERFRPGELGRELRMMGVVSNATAPDMQGIEALGESGIMTTPLELAQAYRQLALKTGDPALEPVLAGLEGAVEFGTAQNASVTGVKVAGKTGSTRSAAGEHIAWFSGFMPSRAPEVIIAVMLAGRSGGADAAPVAGQILQAYRAGRL